MNIRDKINKAFEKMDLYIKPPLPLHKRILVVLDKMIMGKLYGYISDDYYLYQFYKLRLAARKEFLGQNNGQKKVAQFLNNPNEIIKFNSKIVFNETFAKFICRDWLAMSSCSFDEFNDFCAAHPKFLKKEIAGLGGAGIELYIISEDTNLLELYNKLKIANCLVEEIIIQDEALASFNPSSVNTIRVYSILNKANVNIIDAYLRMGVGDVVVDNFHFGGIGAKIDVDTGVIINPGRNMLGQSYAFHPYTKKQIIGIQIPRWDEIKELIKEAALVVPSVRYVAWDVVINNKKEICIIEGNHNGCFNFQEAIDMQGKKAKYEKLLKEIDAQS